jgi:uncharacterized membrane protein YfcA
MLERLLTNADVGVLGAALRIVMGFLLLPAVSLMGEPRPWVAVAALLAMLFSLKAVAAVLRRFVPATARVRSLWAWRRGLARHYDSYQWRKLVWIGVGLLLGALVGRPGGSLQWGLATACLLAGGVGEVFWRRSGLGLTPPREA